MGSAPAAVEAAGTPVKRGREINGAGTSVKRK
jgi:hypothetical protein